MAGVDFVGQPKGFSQLFPQAGHVVQVTSGSAHAARVKKALEEPRLVAWLRAPARFEVWSFAKRGPAGKRKLWTLRAQAVELDGDALRVVDLEKQPTR